MKTSCWTQQGTLLMNPYKMPTSSETSLFTHKSTQTNTANTTAISNLFELGLPQNDAEEKFLLMQRSYRKVLQQTVQQFCCVCCQVLRRSLCAWWTCLAAAGTWAACRKEVAVVPCVQNKRELGKKKKKPDFIHCLAGKIGKCQLRNH